jgi:hypothetical protein
MCARRSSRWRQSSEPLDPPVPESFTGRVYRDELPVITRGASRLAEGGSASEIVSRSRRFPPASQRPLRRGRRLNPGPLDRRRRRSPRSSADDICEPLVARPSRPRAVTISATAAPGAWTVMIYPLDDALGAGGPCKPANHSLINHMGDPGKRHSGWASQAGAGDLGTGISALMRVPRSGGLSR